ncbi:MAG: C39 family peptidase [Lentisphaerae bacterium]|nr:C39 family peptidase [Lentisphaerota bacterium]
MSRNGQRAGAALLLAAALAGSGCQSGRLESGDATRPPPPIPMGPAAVARPAPVSWKALRETHVVMQGLDYSCGAAAMASLFRYYFGADVTEEQVIRNITQSLTEAELLERQENGLSLLDLKHCAERLGYQAVGVRLPFSRLADLKGPVLIHLVRGDYQHFAVLRGVRGSLVYLADPSRGNIRLPAARFRTEWSGAALVLGRADFGLAEDSPLEITEPPPVLYDAITVRQARYSLPR